MSGAIVTVTGRVHRLGDDKLDTDAILPDVTLALRDPAALGRAHCLEALIRISAWRWWSLNDIVVSGAPCMVVVAEHAVVALKAVGIRAIVANSVARIFFRNAINLGLAVIVCPDAARALLVGRGRQRQRDGEHDPARCACWPTELFGDEVAAILASGTRR